MISPLDIAIIAFALGAILTAYVMYRLFDIAFEHAKHCTVCKRGFISTLEGHEDSGTPCYWKRVFARRTE